MSLVTKLLLPFKPKPISKTIKIVNGSTTYQFVCDGLVHKYQIDDWPTPVPSSGEQSAKQRYLQNLLSVKNITNDFAHQMELDFYNHASIMNHLADQSGMETRFGVWYFGPAENNPTNPAATTYSLFARPEGSTPDAVTTPSLNPKPTRYFEGTTNTGVFCLRLNENTGTSQVAVDCERWTSTAWANTIAGVVAATAYANTGGYDQEIFQNGLCMLVNNNGTEQVFYTTNGSTVTAFTNQPSVNAAQGSRLQAFKALLWLFAYSGGAITVQEQTSPTGGAAWTTRGGAASLTGQLRDKDLFLAPDGVTQRIFILTNTGLYYWDETNYLFVYQKTLDSAGRAMLPVNIQGKPALLIFKDAMQVEAYFADGTKWDVSPGGSQGMPSGKDFGVDANGQICVCIAGQYVFALWSGKDTGGTVLKPLILALDLNSMGIVNGKVESAWHNIWQKADTSISSAASYIFVDPQSGDLVAGIQDAVTENTTHVQLKRINVNPELQTTWDRQTAGSFTSPRLDFGAASISTTILSVHHQINGLGTSKSILDAYRVNGATGAYTSVGSASTTDNAATIYPDGTSTGAGQNFRDVQLKWTFAANAATDKIRFYSLDINYVRIPTVRWIYVFNLVHMPYQDTNTTLSVKQQLTNLQTIIGLPTLTQVTYSEEVGAVTGIFISKTQVKEYLGDPVALQSVPRTAISTLYFATMS